MSGAVFAEKQSAAPGLKDKAAGRAALGNLRIGEPNDSFEREADRMADQIMAGGRPKLNWSLSKMSIAVPLQRKCSCGGSGGASGECEECKEKKALQRNAIGPAETGVAPPIVHEVLNSPGQPLDRATREFFEPRFGHDFSHVQIHANQPAAASTRAVNALAYTVGRDMVFGDGQYSPKTPEGRRLIAHELTHVVQQAEAAGPGGACLAVDSSGSVAESEAASVADSVLGGNHQLVVGTRRGAVLQRQSGQRQRSATNQCPTSTSLDTYSPFNHSNLAPSEQAKFRTYLGTLVRHSLSPGPDHTGHCAKEELSTVSTDCPAGMTSIDFCSKSDCLPVNRPGQDKPTGTSLPSNPKAFLDLHRTTSTRSILEGTGKNSCRVVCEQKYHCDSLGAPVLGTFRITRNFRADTSTPPGGSPQHITTGEVEKVEKFGKGDFPERTLPKGEEFA
jgi:hypothetical protein